ncbi:MAG TPA: putative zinc-binding metallopeptidase, partial [Candidatus Angelobacter sp.]|nr:putative zinc-binding metallopeptidase [Candidatus Angelobacter sp.]
ATAFGLRVQPGAGRDSALAMTADFDPYGEDDFAALVRAWLPLTYALNSLNQSMGQAAFYPFVLVPPVMEKLRFIHDVIRRSSIRESS